MPSWCRAQLIQRRCRGCGGSGLVQRGRFPRKCPECKTCPLSFFKHIKHLHTFHLYRWVFGTCCLLPDKLVRRLTRISSSTNAGADVGVVARPLKRRTGVCARICGRDRRRRLLSLAWVGGVHVCHSAPWQRRPPSGAAGTDVRVLQVPPPPLSLSPPLPFQSNSNLRSAFGVPE